MADNDDDFIDVIPVHTEEDREILRGVDERTKQLSDEQRSEIQEHLFMSELITPDSIYVDLSLFKDFQMGAIITLTESQEQLDYIKSRLSVYNTRHYDDIGFLFPEVQITTQQVQDRLVEQHYHQAIFAVSPMTAFGKTFATHLYVNSNHARVKQYKKAISVFVNTYPLILPKPFHDTIGEYFTNTFGVNVQIGYIPPENFTPKFLDRFEELYTCHMKPILDNKEIHEAFCNCRWAKSNFFIPTIFGTVVDPKRRISLEVAMNKAFIDVVVNIFQYIKPKMLAIANM